VGSTLSLTLHPFSSFFDAFGEANFDGDGWQNIMISGKSIGGNDDVQQLEKEGRLGDTIHSMGGKRIMKVLKLKE